MQPRLLRDYLIAQRASLLLHPDFLPSLERTIEAVIFSLRTRQQGQRLTDPLAGMGQFVKVRGRL